MTNHDPILTALQDGREQYWQKFLTDTVRTHPEQIYDRGVMEGLRWAIDTYKTMKTEEGQ